VIKSSLHEEQLPLLPQPIVFIILLSKMYENIYLTKIKTF
jgi:hypothetical protein